MKMAIGMIMQETNSFSSIKTDIEDFKYSPFVPLLEGFDLIEEHRGKNTEVGGFIKACEENGVEIVPTIATFAVPSGNVTQRAFRWLVDLLLTALKQSDGLDGVLLALHGSMVVDGLDDPDGEILAQVRELVGEGVSIGCTLDLHANVTQRMIANSDILIGYETHRDMAIIGMRVAEKVMYCINKGIKPQLSLRKIPAVMVAGRCVLDLKRKTQREPGVLAISVFDMQPWLEVEEYGPSVVAVTEGKKELGDKLCAELADKLWDLREQALRHLVPISEVVERVKHSGCKSIVLTESCDIIGGGGSGDSVALLDALLREGITSVVGVVYDPIAVSRAFEAGLGSEIELDIGGKYEFEGSIPLRFRGSVKLLYDGRYVLKGVNYGGINAFVGRTAVIGSGDTDIVLTSKRIVGGGAALFDALKMDVSGKKAIALKGGGGAFDFLVADVIGVYTPGWCAWDFCRIPFKKVRRPIYPLDPM